MAVDGAILDGHGGGYRAKVDPEGSLNMVVHPHPPLTETREGIPLVQYLTDDGLATGDRDMRTDGSVNNVSYYISAHPTLDMYIQTMSIVIADAGASLNEWGAQSALTNGMKLTWSTLEGEVVINNELKSNWDFVRMALGYPAFGTGTNSFKANNVIGGSEGFIPIMRFKDMFGMPWGFKLRAGTTDRITMLVRDDNSNIDQFDALCLGVCF